MVLLGRKLSVLLVDDDPDILECFGYYFRDAGLEVTGMTDPREAIAAASRILPDVIVLDVKMPDLDGFDVIDAIRARPETAAISIVLFTGSLLPGVSGVRQVSACVRKPSTPSQLLALVQMLANRA
jgi:CheY-like chemotaxis protein